MLPSIFGENLFDDFFGDPFGMMMPQGRDPLYGKHAKNLMKTDVREMDGSYELDVDLPGFKKDEVHVDLKNGYLTISAEKGLDKNESDKKGKYIRQERYAGACSRSFYVGEDVDRSRRFRGRRKVNESCTTGPRLYNRGPVELSKSLTEFVAAQAAGQRSKSACQKSFAF